MKVKNHKYLENSLAVCYLFQKRGFAANIWGRKLPDCVFPPSQKRCKGL